MCLTILRGGSLASVNAKVAQSFQVVPGPHRLIPSLCFPGRCSCLAKEW